MFLLLVSLLPFIHAQSPTSNGNTNTNNNDSSSATAAVNVAFFFLFFIAIGGLILMVLIKRYCRNGFLCFRRQLDTTATSNHQPGFSFMYPLELVDLDPQAHQAEQETTLSAGQPVQPLRWPPLPSSSCTTTINQRQEPVPRNVSLHSPSATPPTIDNHAEIDHDSPPPLYDITKEGIPNDTLQIHIHPKMSQAECDDEEYVHTPSRGCSKIMFEDGISADDSAIDPPSYNSRKGFTTTLEKHKKEGKIDATSLTPPAYSIAMPFPSDSASSSSHSTSTTAPRPNPCSSTDNSSSIPTIASEIDAIEVASPTEREHA